MIRLDLKSPRWVMIINALRMCTYDKITRLSTDGTDVLVSGCDDGCVDIIHPETGEVLVSFDEDGCPFNISEWAKDDWNWCDFEYPVYTYNVYEPNNVAIKRLEKEIDQLSKILNDIKENM